MNLDSKTWVLGKDYSAAPTCATCHMSATKDLHLTHDVGARISWTLRPEVSSKLESGRRAARTCRRSAPTATAKDWVENFYKQYDAAVGSL